MRNSRELQCTAAVVLAVLVQVGSYAQFLDLDPVPAEPPLDRSQLLDRTAREMRSQMGGIDEHVTADEVVSTIAAGMRAYRQVAFELLAESRRHEDGHHGALAGLLLVEESDHVDQLLIRLGSEEPTALDGRVLDQSEVAGLLALVDRFSAQAGALMESIDASRTDQVDAALLLGLEPLLEVLSVLEGMPRVDPWVLHQLDPRPPLHRLSAARDAISDPALKARMDALLEIVQPLINFVDLRRQIEVDGIIIAEALELEHAIALADWLPADRREACMQRLDRALQEWMDPGSRSQAVQALKHLAAVTDLVESTNRLDELDPAGRARRRSIDEVVSEDLDGDRPQRLQSRSRRLRRAASAIDAAVMVRELERQPPAPHLRATRRILDGDYKRSEREFFERLPEFVGTNTALVDPDLAGLVARQIELADDLQLLRESQAWSELAMKIEPGERARFNNAVQKVVQQLAQPTNRPEASRSLDVMAGQFRAVLHHPFITRLESGDDAVIEMVGGRDRELREAIEAASRDLVRFWARDGDRAGIRKAELVIRLLDDLEMLAELHDAGGTDQLLRWGGWLVHTSAGKVDSELIASRVKIAIESLLRNDLDEVVNQLEQISVDAPLALLAARLGGRLGAGLRDLPESTGASLARIARTPMDDAALLEYREDLMKLARYTWELGEARRDGRREDAEVIRAYCAALASQLAEDLDEED